MGYAGWAFALMSFMLFGSGVMVGRMSVKNHIKAIENSTEYDLEVELDDKGIMTIR